MTIVINGLDMKSLRNDEYIQFDTQILQVTNSYDPAGLKVKPQYDALNLKLVEIDGVYALIQKSMQTEPLEKADERRDKAIAGISMNVDSMLNHFKPELVAAAKLLRADLDKYDGNISRKTYNAETAVLTNIAEDWKTVPALTDAVNKLTLKEWLEELDIANKAFNDIYMLRNKESLNNPDQTLKDLRLQANDLYYELRDKLSAYANVNDFASPYDKVMKEWNSLIDDYNQTLATRQGKKAASDNKEVVATPGILA